MNSPIERFESLRRIAEAHPSIAQGYAFHFALFAHCLGLGIKGVDPLLNALSNLPEGMAGLLRGMLSKRIEEASLDRPQLPLTGFVFSGSYRHQLLPLAKGLRDRGACSPIGFLDLREWNAGAAERIHPYLDLPLVPLPDPSLLSVFSNLTAVFAPDTAHRMLEHLPRKVKRIALMHGIIGKPEYTLSHEGGGTIFDHILHPGFPSISEDVIEGVFPPSMIRHSSPSVKLVPAGYPKLDEMISAFQAKGGDVERKVAIHLSVEDHDSKAGMEQLPGLIEDLLSITPSVAVVFRPFPGVATPFASGIVSRFQGRRGFTVSRAESYVEDYAGAAAFVTLKETTAEIATLATGAPTFCLIPERKPGPFSRGRICGSSQDVLERLKTQFVSPWRERSRILAERDRTFSRVGSSIDAVAELLASFRENSSSSQCRDLRLGISTEDSDRDAHLASLRRLAFDPKYATTEASAQVVASSLERFPVDAEILILCAENLLRIAVRHQAFAATQRTAPHHFHYAEMFLLVHLAASTVFRSDANRSRELELLLAAQGNEALRTLRIVEEATISIENYQFPQLESIRRFLTSQNKSGFEAISTLETHARRHPNHPCDCPRLASAIRSGLLSKAEAAITSGAFETAKPLLRLFVGTSDAKRLLELYPFQNDSLGEIPLARLDILELLAHHPEIHWLWEAMAAAILKSPLDCEELGRFEELLPLVFQSEDRLSQLWNAAESVGNTEALEAMFDLVASQQGAPPDLLSALSSIAQSAATDRLRSTK